MNSRERIELFLCNIKENTVIEATIAFLESFLEYLNVNNSLKQFLSSMSVYAIPTMEEIYETA